jgi:hypothetical protein
MARLRRSVSTKQTVRKDPGNGMNLESAVGASHRTRSRAQGHIGNSATQEGEGADVADFQLFGRQEELLTRVLDAHPNAMREFRPRIVTNLHEWTYAVIRDYWCAFVGHDWSDGEGTPQFTGLAA